uniref:Uncharacterized protein n=1 Tax=Populus trichocarpa TaxID=3694 RepID=A0A3N7EQI6_POPTR
MEEEGISLEEVEMCIGMEVVVTGMVEVETYNSKVEEGNSLEEVEMCIGMEVVVTGMVEEETCKSTVEGETF